MLPGLLGISIRRSSCTLPLFAALHFKPLLSALKVAPEQQGHRCEISSSAQPLASVGARGKDTSKDSKAQWEALVAQLQEPINPCNSKLHPAVLHGIIAPQGDEVCVQEAYTPQSTCFGCGPANPDGLQLRSTRIKNGLEARISLGKKYCAFPGIVNGGVVSAILDCHGNWTAAIALMDKACLPRPPLTLTASMLVTYKDPTPPDVSLLVRSQVMSIKESSQPGIGKASVEVETRVYLCDPDSAEGSERPGHMKLLVVGQGVHKRLGALRAL